MTTSVFNDLFQVLVRIASNPLTLLLYFLGVSELFFLAAGSKFSVLSMIEENLQKLLENASPFTKSFLNCLIAITKFLYEKRESCAILYLFSIPVILDERDIMLSALFALLLCVLPSISPLQVFFCCQVWIVYNSLQAIHKLLLVILVACFVYYDGLTHMSRDSDLHKKFLNIFRNTSVPEV